VRHLLRTPQSDVAQVDGRAAPGEARPSFRMVSLKESPENNENKSSQEYY